MKLIFDYNRTLFNPNSGQVYPGVFGMLRNLSQKHQLILVTLNSPGRKNSSAIQDMQQYFSEVHFVERKTVSHFASFLTDDEQAIVIGDSFENEIRIGIQLQLITIHIQPEAKKNRFKQTATHTISEVTKIMKILKSYE